MTQIQIATQHLNDILTLAIQKKQSEAALVIYDTDSKLAITLAEAYRNCLPQALFIDFATLTSEEMLAAFKALSAGDLVVLIQSSNFRPKDFRIRVELFEKSIKVIEHPHLARMTGIEIDYYIDSLAYDPAYFRGVGHALKNQIDSAKKCVVDSGDAELVFESGLESAKLNIGDYTAMKNIGGQFPIGEVFTEAKTLESVNGRVRIFAFADNAFNVAKPDKPITLVVSEGRVVEVIDSTLEFDAVLTKIRTDEGSVWLRELGFGMNRAFTQTKVVSDIGTYERMCGIHLSLGAKHGVYKKSNFKRDNMWHHVDVFAITQKVYLDEAMVFSDGAWHAETR